MHKISIVIPTLKNKNEILKQKNEIEKYNYKNYEIIYSCKKQSASKNRNYCLNNATGNIIIMLDDDICGFYENWIDDFIYPLIDNKYSIVAARLLNIHYQLGHQIGTENNNEIINNLQIAEYKKLNIVCSAAICFFKNDIRFDENYIKAGYEDCDFCMQYKQKYPNKKIIINYKCKLIHLNERKWKTSNIWFSNIDLFIKKWNKKI